MERIYHLQCGGMSKSLCTAARKDEAYFLTGNGVHSVDQAKDKQYGGEFLHRQGKLLFKAFQNMKFHPMKHLSSKRKSKGCIVMAVMADQIRMLPVFQCTITPIKELIPFSSFWTILV
jgi:hypothetical protein